MALLVVDPRGRRAAADGRDVIVDVTDDEAPTRYFYDYCALPPSVGDRAAMHAVVGDPCERSRQHVLGEESAHSERAEHHDVAGLQQRVVGERVPHEAAARSRSAKPSQWLVKSHGCSHSSCGSAPTICAATARIAVAAIAPTGTVVSVEKNSPIADRPSIDTAT